MKIGGKSKRIGLHKQHKILKKIKEHHRNVRKEAKKGLKSKKHEKVEVIPFNIPNREALIKQNEEVKLLEKEANLRRMKLISKMKEDKNKNEVKLPKSKDVSLAFAGNIEKLVEECNVIIEVLDARDPLGTRCKETEDKILKNNKKLIFVLNKIDLVPCDNVKKWIEYLSKTAYVIPFKCSTQKQMNKVGNNNKYTPDIYIGCNNSAYGVDKVMNYLRSVYVKDFNSDGTKISNSKNIMKVGVMGMPNTGKSSFINSLKRKRICESGNNPGMTRHLQYVAIDGHITLIDSPGVVLSTSVDPAEVALRNCTRIEKIDDPELVAKLVFDRSDKQQLMTLFKLEEFETYEELLLQIAKRYCPLKKGGICNTRSAAVKLLHDWTTGNIFYCSQPPESDMEVDKVSNENTKMTTEEENVLMTITNNFVNE